MAVVNISPRSHERGSIEACRLPRHRMRRSPLRVLTNAAPLKHAGSLEVQVSPDGSPRSHERGSIEAAGTAARQRRRRYSPRSHERGSIEAGAESLRDRAQGPALRVLTNAAPLKPEGIRTMRALETTLRVLTNAAPLKPCGCRWTRSHLTSSPRSHERGSIEASVGDPVAVDTQRLSAFSRTRLH